MIKDLIKDRLSSWEETFFYSKWNFKQEYVNLVNNYTMDPKPQPKLIGIAFKNKQSLGIVKRPTLGERLVSLGNLSPAVLELLRLEYELRSKVGVVKTD